MNARQFPLSAISVVFLRVTIDGLFKSARTLATKACGGVAENRALVWQKDGGAAPILTRG